MDSFGLLHAAAEEVKAGRAAARSFYELYWEHVVAINRGQYQQFHGFSAAIGSQSDLDQAIHRMFEGMFEAFHDSTHSAYEKFSEAISLFRSQGERQGEAAAMVMQAIYLKDVGRLDKALQYLQEASWVLERDSLFGYFLLLDYYQTAEIHQMMQDQESAVDFLGKLLNMSQPGQSITIRSVNAMATIYAGKKDFEKAEYYFNQALELIRDSRNMMLKSKIYADIGNCSFKRGFLETALDWHMKSIQLREESNLRSPLITNYTDLAEIYLAKYQLEEALHHAQKAEKLANEFRSILKQYNIYRVLSAIYEEMGDFRHALAYHKNYFHAKEKILSQESARRIQHMTTMHEMESMQKEKEIFTLKNVYLKNALDEIESSVRYARRIQETILPPSALVNKLLPDSFVLYKPKDIVAGDFYWVEQKDDCVMVAVADCTGHGVPGAMVSVICNNHLNRHLHMYSVTDPGKLLEMTRQTLVSEFEKSDVNVQDGMDISLLCFSQGRISWSGANNPLWIIRDGALMECQPDKQPVGKFAMAAPFNTHVVEGKKGDMLYIFSDGYADQFGGPQGKKFKTKQLRKLLLQVSSLPVLKQRSIINETFESWRGKMEQVDDVCIMGIRI